MAGPAGLLCVLRSCGVVLSHSSSLAFFLYVRLLRRLSKVLLRNNNNIVKDSESGSCLKTCCSRQSQPGKGDSKKALTRSAVCSLSSLKVTKMPFMLQSCGHAMRFAAPDGICRRCSSDMEGISSNESSGNEMRVNAENEEPEEVGKHEDELMNGGTNAHKKSFGDQVNKLVGPVVYSEGPEITESFVHVARSMSTFTAAERADFIFHLVITYCEARREDQPKIQGLLAELAKKNVLAKTHILQSAKRLASEAAGLVIDWPNVYSCTIELLGALLARSDEKETVENLTALRKAFKETRGFLQCLYSTYPNLGLETSQTTPKKRGSMVARASFSERRASMGTNKTLPFFRSPIEVKDRFVQPVGLRPPSSGKPPAHVYTREEMLKLGEAVKKRPLPVAILEAVRVIKNDTWVGDRDNQQLKRPRYVSESAAHNEGFNPTKRMLESTSPTFGGDNGGSSRNLQPLPEKGYNQRNQFFGGPRQRYVSESHHHQQQQPSTSKSPTPAATTAPPSNAPRNVPEVSPRGKAVSPPSQRGAPGSKPRYNSVSTSSPVKMEPARSGQDKGDVNGSPQPPPVAPHGAPHGQANRHPHGHNGRPGNAKPNKFLTALHVERVMETESSQLSPTLSPGVKGSWAQGSGMQQKGGGEGHQFAPPLARPFGTQGANRHAGPAHGQFRTGYSGAPRQAQPGSSEENWRRPVQP